MFCETTTTTAPCESPFPPSELSALVPNPETMTTCEEITKSVFDIRAKIYQWIRWLLKDDGTLSDAFRCMFCGSGCASVGLDGARWEIPCLLSDPVTQICACAADPDDQTKIFHADPTKTYNVTFRFRGLVEWKDYTGGAWPGSDWFYIGGTPTGDPSRNIYSLTVQDPPKTYYLNKQNPASAGGPPFTFPIDYNATIPIRGGSMVLIHATSSEGTQASNYTHQVVAGVDPAPSWFNGQFIQIDIVSIAEQ